MLSFFALVLLCKAPWITVHLEAPRVLKRWEVGEFKLHVEGARLSNPFTEVSLWGSFKSRGFEKRFPGFCDSEDGSLFVVRFAPPAAGRRFEYEIVLSAKGRTYSFAGSFKTVPSDLKGPVVVDPRNPKHFVYAGTRRHFYHLGYTAYHLLDPSKSDADIKRTLDLCKEFGFTKIRFLLTGYPRDNDKRSLEEARRDFRRIKNRWRLPNYGAWPRTVLPLPAWKGEPHRYDFRRFNLKHWRRCDKTIRWALERGIVATCIMTIEKQSLPREIGALSFEEKLLYKYAASRLGAFPNVWWDLGNEHNEYRWPGGSRAFDDPKSREWAESMGKLVHKWDPDRCLVSAHGYDRWIYGNAQWADYIITQQYGDPTAVNSWALKYLSIPKPYVNEEYGYEGRSKRYGHGQNADLVRKCHWAVALAGGYATYGDWTEGAPFYTGKFGKGKAVRYLKYLREFFESIPWWRMTPCNDCVKGGFCLREKDKRLLLYLPEGMKAEVKIGGRYQCKWFDPRGGKISEGPALSGGNANEWKVLEKPDGRDWVLLLEKKDSLPDRR